MKQNLKLFESMKKFSISILCLFVAEFFAFGQDLTLDQIAGYLDEYAVSAKVNFDIQSSDPIFGSADLYLDGLGYIVKVDGYSFYCDGKTRWTVDESTKEVYVEKDDLKINPVVLLSQSKIKFDDGWPSELSIPVKDDIVAVIRIKSLQPTEKGTQKCALDVSKLDNSYIVTDLR